MTRVRWGGDCSCTPEKGIEVQQDPYRWYYHSQEHHLATWGGVHQRRLACSVQGYEYYSVCEWIRYSDGRGKRWGQTLHVTSSRINWRCWIIQLRACQGITRQMAPANGTRESILVRWWEEDEVPQGTGVATGDANSQTPLTPPHQNWQQPQQETKATTQHYVSPRAPLPEHLPSPLTQGPTLKSHKPKPLLPQPDRRAGRFLC